MIFAGSPTALISQAPRHDANFEPDSSAANAPPSAPSPGLVGWPQDIIGDIEFFPIGLLPSPLPPLLVF
uniref:Uncharacterized protein n=1 Tax=Oryza rufipogon TaxID=4529 RepID=A0A0E0R927_ORYRU